MIWWLLVVVLLVGALFAHRRQKQRAHRARLRARLRAIAQLRLLRELLEQVQRHRGLCFGVMSGAHALESDRWTVQAHVTRLFDLATEHQANLAWHDPWKQAYPLWQEIDWQPSKRWVIAMTLSVWAAWPPSRRGSGWSC